MLMRRVSAKDKIPNGLLRGAAVAGLVSGLAAASLGGVPTASATCVGIFGININLGDGGGCTSSLFGFALGLGPGTIARAQGFFVGAISVGLGNTPTDLTAADATGAFTLAYAGGANATTLTRGNLALAAGQGPNTFTQAGGTPVDVGNVALNLGANNFVVAGDIAQNPNNRSYFNLAVNLGHDNNVQSRGLGNNVWNIVGNGNGITAVGVLNNATNFFGDNNELIASNVPDPTANILRQIGLNVAFNTFGNGNVVHAGSQIAPPRGGPLAIAGAIGVSNRTFSQPGFGVTLATPFNNTGGNTNVLAAGGTAGNRVRLNSTGGNTNGVAAGSTQGSRSQPDLNAASNRPQTTSPGGSVRTSVSDRITKLAKKFSDPASRGTGGGLARGAKADPASTGSNGGSGNGGGSSSNGGSNGGSGNGGGSSSNGGSNGGSGNGGGSSSNGGC